MNDTASREVERMRRLAKSVADILGADDSMIQIALVVRFSDGKQVTVSWRGESDESVAAMLRHAADTEERSESAEAQRTIQ